MRQVLAAVAGKGGIMPEEFIHAAKAAEEYIIASLNAESDSLGEPLRDLTAKAHHVYPLNPDVDDDFGGEGYLVLVDYSFTEYVAHYGGDQTYPTENMAIWVSPDFEDCEEWHSYPLEPDETFTKV